MSCVLYSFWLQRVQTFIAGFRDDNAYRVRVILTTRYRLLNIKSAASIVPGDATLGNTGQMTHTDSFLSDIDEDLKDIRRKRRRSSVDQVMRGEPS